MQAFDYYSELYKKPSGRPITAPGTITGQVPRPGAPTTPQAPELEGMKHSPYSGFMQMLSKQIPFEGRYQQRFNLARGGIQSGTRTALEQMKTFMGGRGFRGGESGYADVPLAQIATGGAERLSQAGLQIGESEAERKQAYDMMNLQRMIGGGQLGLAGEEGIQNRLLQYLALLSGTEQQRWQPYWGAAGATYAGG